MTTLRELRQNRGIRVGDLARLAGVDPSTIVNIEEGRTTPKRRTVRRLCDALRVEPTEVAEFALATGSGAGTSKRERLLHGR